MKNIDYSQYFRRIIELLEKDTVTNRVGRLETQRKHKQHKRREERGEPLHSGHAGGEFLSEARTEFKHRFKNSGLA